ncbi:MAG: TonB-dependent receptor [Terracidiphilus sp.]|jgi:hypothetical protein
MTRRTGSVLAICILLLFGIAMGIPAVGQTGAGAINGTVTDPSGAVIATATVALAGPAGIVKSVKTGHDGAYRMTGVAAGTYRLSISAEGFAPSEVDNVVVAAGKTVLENVTLQIPIAQQQVVVSDSTASVDTSAEDNASSIVIKGKDLNALSDDPDELQSELTALAGPAAGPNGAQIFIDGFSGGQLPPKSSIREIRVNQNPFSAQYDKLGYGRIEVLTKPGTDKLHGNVMIMGNDSAFNSLNPFVTEEPAYYSTFMNASVGGSLGTRTSWFASVFRRDNASNSIINAELLDSSNNVYNYTKAVATPQSRLDISPRLDFQLGSRNTMTVRYMLDRQKQTNGGVSQTALETQGFDSSGYENSLQISDSQVLSQSAVNETRFQYIRSTDNQTPYSTDPTVMVSGAFTGGGSSAGRSRDTENHYEIEDYVTLAKGAHSIEFGGRFRLTRDSSYSTAGFNGAYVYSSLTAYAAKTPSQYTVTAGNANASVSMFDLGLFYQDDYKVNPNLTLSYGARYETQNQISDHNDWAPRLSLAWAPGGAKSKTVIRGGYGWFYDRFNANNALTAIRQNGVNENQYVVKSPSFYENAPPASTLATLSTVAPTIYQIAPNMKASLSMQAAAGVEHQFGSFATVSLTYLNSRGVHQYLSDNVNAYEQGTYDITTGTGTRPNGINENIYQFQSGGVYKQNQLMVNYSVQSKRVSLFGFYALTFANADTSGASYFPTNQTNPGADFGRANFDVRNRFLIGGNIQGPYGISFNPMLDVTSGSPFNITIGQDLNGDNQYNDRPAIATASSTNVVTTKYGTFDLDPAAAAQRIPYNVGTGPSEMGLNMRVSKTFGIGPKVTSGSRSAFGGMGGPPPGGGPPGGGGPGGGLGPGGLSGSRGGPPGMNNQTAARRYSLTFAAMGRNVLNSVNLAAPVGVLSSPKFGQSISLGGGPWSSAASNRSIDLQVTFNF